MTIRSAIWPFPARIKTELQIDPVLLGIVLALLMGGFVILASASISISDNATSNPFFYVQRQLLAAAIGAVAGVVCARRGADPPWRSELPAGWSN